MRSVPRPYLIEPPLEDDDTSLDGATHYLQGRTLSFDVLLFGRVIDYWPTVFLAFKKLGALGIGQGRGRFRISRVESIRGCEVKEVYTADTGTLAAGLLRFTPDMFFHNTTRCVSRLVLQLLTPIQLTHANQPVSIKADLTFHIFMRRLLGRLSDLSYHHGEERFGWDYQRIIQQAERVYMHETASVVVYRSIEVHSARQDPTYTEETSYQLTGFVGTVVYEGEGLEAFLPYLWMGEYTHIGKKTVQGAGKYKILEPASGLSFVGCDAEGREDKHLRNENCPGLDIGPKLS